MNKSEGGILGWGAFIGGEAFMGVITVYRLDLARHYIFPRIPNFHNVFSTLRTHDTFTMKTTANETFVHFLYWNLITLLDRPNKVYIFLKLRAFCT